MAANLDSIITIGGDAQSAELVISCLPSLLLRHAYVAFINEQRPSSGGFTPTLNIGVFVA